MAKQYTETMLVGSGEQLAAQGAAVPTAEALEMVAPLAAKACFNKLLPRAATLAEAELAPINVHIVGAIASVTWALQAVQPYKEQLEALPHNREPGALTALAEITKALGWAQGLYKTAVTVPQIDPQLLEKATAVRRLLLAAANVQLAHGLVTEEELDELNGPNGYRNVGGDLLALQTVVWNVMESSGDSGGLSQQDITQCEEVVWKLLAVTGQREHASERIAQAKDQRRRMFTLFVREYSQLRRGVQYQRWDEGDAEELAPSLYTKRNRHEARDAEGVDEDPDLDIETDAEELGSEVSATESPPIRSPERAPVAFDVPDPVGSPAVPAASHGAAQASDSVGASGPSGTAGADAGMAVEAAGSAASVESVAPAVGIRGIPGMPGGSPLN